MGSAAVAMSLDLSPVVPSVENRIFINDVNEELVNVYRVLKHQPEQLIKRLRRMELDTTEKKYYEIREKQERSEIGRAARVIYLNRTCFNGLYRENSRGKFNVPYGRLVNPTVCNEPLLKAVSKWLSFVSVTQGHFRVAVEASKRNDVVYFDPPYIPLSETSSFSKYNATDFGLNDHLDLSALIERLTKRGVRVMLSNSDCEKTREIYMSSGLSLHSIRVQRNIGARGTSRVKVRELIGINYDMSDCKDPRYAAKISQKI